MKKRFVVLIIFLLTALSIFLCACDPSSYYLDNKELESDIVSVELIYYDFNEMKHVKEVEEILPFDFSKMELIENLDNSKLTNFLKDVSTLEFLLDEKFCNSITGYCIKLNYFNNDFLIIYMRLINKTGYGGAVKFDFKGKIIEVVDTIATGRDYVSLVNKYFVTQIELSY